MNTELCTEGKRIEFIYKRDGLQAAIDFCERTLKIYRTCLVRGKENQIFKAHHATLPQYREKFIHSCVAFKFFLRTYKGEENG